MQKLAVIPYVHGLSHNLKKVVQRYDVKVMFSAPHKVSKHRRPFVEFLRSVERRRRLSDSFKERESVRWPLGDVLTIG